MGNDIDLLESQEIEATYMNHEELEELINQSSSKQRATTPMVRPTERQRSIAQHRDEPEKRVHQPAGVQSSTRPGQGTSVKHNQSKEQSQKRRPKAGDMVKVTKGRNQGATGIITRETPAQYEISSNQVNETFHKWKSNVKLTRPKDE